MMDDHAIRTLETLTVARYSDRLKKLGRDPRTLGWDTADHQRQRFAAALRLTPCAGKELIDIGCGFGDLLTFLDGRRERPRTYTGLDINSELLGVAAQLHPSARFECRNILTDPLPSQSADIVTVFGVLNWRLPVGDNLQHARAVIGGAWEAAREAVVVDMLSEEADVAYPREDFVFYYRPVDMLAFALTLTPYVALLHEYPGIPQREFTLVLRRRPCE